VLSAARQGWLTGPNSADWELPPARGSVCLGARLGGQGAEVVVLQAVAVALEGEDLSVVDEPVDRCGGGASAPKISPHALNGVSDRLARS
jgi:hypothetical protein